MKFRIRLDSEHRLKYKSTAYKVFHFVGKLTLFLFILILLLIGFTQTSYFRNFLKDQITKIAQNELNGDISIESIYGTLFSTITIKNLKYDYENTEIASVQTLHISVNPISLLDNTISINKIFIENLSLNVIQFSDSQWVFNKLLKQPPKPDTLPAKKFDYDILIKNVNFSNCKFHLIRFIDSLNQISELRYYSDLNFNDLRIEKFNLKFKAALRLKNNQYQLKVDDLNFLTNVFDFGIKKLNFDFKIKDNLLSLQPFELQTLRSRLSIAIRVNDFNLNDSTLFENISNKYFNVNLVADKFDFADLRNIIHPVNMLNGRLYVDANVEGSLNELSVNELKIQLDSTKINAKGVLRDIMQGEYLFMDVNLDECEILMKDVSKFLPLYSIPEFPSLGKIKLNGSHKGSPLNFESMIKIETLRGAVDGLAQFDFSRKIPTYNVQLKTENLSLEPFTGLEGFVNSVLSVSGEGFSPKEINSKLFFLSKNSQLKNNKIDSVQLRIDANKNLFTLNFFTFSDTTSLQLNGLLDLRDEKSPEYELSLNGRNLDLQQHFDLYDFPGLLNLSGSLKGKSFDINNLNAIFSLSIFDTKINNNSIDNSTISLKVDQLNENNKILTLKSDIVDAEISGNYDFDKVIESVALRFDEIEKFVQRKINLFEGKLTNDSLTLSPVKDRLKSKKLKTENLRVSEKDFAVNYRVEFKDSDLINIFLKNVKVNIDGEFSGKLEQKNSQFNFSIKSDLKDLWFVDPEKSYRIKDAELNSTIELNEINELNVSPNLSARLRVKRVLLNNEISDFDFGLKFDKDTLNYRLQSFFDSLLFVRSEGLVYLTPQNFNAQIQKITVEFKKYKLTNEGILKFAFSKDNVFFENFVLRRKNERLRINGLFGYTGDQNLSLSIENLELFDLALNFLPEIKEDIDGKINITASLKGTSKSPIIISKLSLNDFVYGTDRLGDLSGVVNYNKERLEASIKYVDETFNGEDLSINAQIPIDLSFEGSSKGINRKENFLVQIIVNNFNLTPLRAIVPVLKTLEGSLNGEVNISGTFDRPIFYGIINSSGSKITLAQNNLKYQADLSIIFQDDRIVIEQFDLLNLDTKKRGKLITNGTIQIDNRGIKDLKFFARGNLLVLGNESRSVSPNFYGDVFIEVASPIIVEGNYNDYSITGDLVIKETSLIIPPIETAYNTEEETFVYRYVSYISEIDPADLAFIKAEQELRAAKKSVQRKSDNLLSKVSARLKISLKNNVSMQLIFNRELNQRLFADLKGEVIYNISENQTSIQGKIELTQDSYLVFYQKFNATGSIQFESEITNPYLDVTATYSNYYVTGDSINVDVKDVTIKLKLIGTVTELGKNLVSNKENIEITINGTADKTKDASDAVAFILVGKFKDDLTAEDKASTAQTWGGTFQSAASSLLGSVITNFANSIFGDVLRNVEFKRVGEETKFSFEGRIKEFRFKVGGGTDVFQNFALANIQLEYPISEKMYLRLMRKQSQLQSTKPIEMINEFGLKYKIEF